MKVKLFWGIPPYVQSTFNDWAKGKALAKDIIIHTIYVPYEAETKMNAILIAVYYPEGSQFDQ